MERNDNYTDYKDHAVAYAEIKYIICVLQMIHNNIMIQDLVSSGTVSYSRL